jgi:2-dehydro-3-deoxyglucarate aldolase
MKRSELKKHLRQQKLILSGWTSIGNSQISELLLESKINCLGIDIEHSTISQEQSMHIILACNNKAKSCLPRVASHNPESIRRLLDSGADGIIVPNVESNADVKKIVNWVKYPPIGKRGYGIARAQNYGHDFKKYTKGWNKDSILMIQIESINAVNNIESIIDDPNIDCVIVGPYDISGSLGIPGQIQHEKVVKACKIVITACKKYNLSCGIHVPSVTEQSIRDSIKKGFNFIILASDVFILRDWATDVNSISLKWPQKKRR